MPAHSTPCLILHLTGLSSFIFSFHLLTTFDVPAASQYGWHFQYLTVVGLLLSLITFSFALLADLTFSPTLYTAKNTLAIVAAPLEVLVSILYWGIRIIDPTLLVPKDGPDLALSVDVGLHLLPAVVLVLDLILWSPPWTIRAYSMVGTGVFLAVLYWVWVELCFSKNGVYPYPLMDLLSAPQRALLFAFSGSLFAGSGIALKWLYGCINGAPHIEAEATKPFKKVE